MFQKGQTIIILLLVVVIALGIGLTVVGRSITEISTSTKTEESTRAFAAAEAGIERALSRNSGIGQGSAGNLSLGSSDLTNQSSADVSWNPLLPDTSLALEYPPFGKESFAQVWLADPIHSTNGYPNASYNQNNFDIYFGKIDDTYYAANPDQKPAIEVVVVYRDGNNFNSISNFYDSYSGTNPSSRNNSFSGCAALKPASIVTNQNSNSGRIFYCQVHITGFPYNVGANQYPVMARIRVLYSNISHPVALQPTGGSSLPRQVAIFTSTGESGGAQKTIRTIQVFQQKSVMPNLFNYALFSAGALNK